MSADLAGSTGLSAEAVFENRHAARFVFDPCADEIYEVNEATCSMLGYTRAELLQLGPSDFHPEEMESFRRFVAAARRHSEVWTDDLTCTTKTGRKIPVEMSLSEAKVEPTTTAPSEDTLVAVVRDVSDRIHQREQLQVEIRVVDDGPGVPSDEQIVTEAGVSPTAVRHNSGMGLWTVSWIAQLCDGTLDIRERRGGDGTVAAIRLPANETTDCRPPERVDTGTETDTLVDGDERDCVN